MRYILRKFVDAPNAAEAIRMDRKTPAHDCYMREPEQSPNQELPPAIGFEMRELGGVPLEMRRKR